MSIQTLIDQYEARLRQMSIDQSTDDAMSSEAYCNVSFTLEQVVNDLKSLLAASKA